MKQFLNVVKFKINQVFIGGLIFLIMSLSFQNCSRTELSKVSSEMLYESPSLDLKANVCPDTRLLPPQGSKYIFVIDMSASNVGSWYSQSLGGKKFYYWDRNLQTDVAGDRFTAVKFFLDNCGNQNGNQYAIIGFSQSVGVIQNQAGKNVLSCLDNDINFVDRATAASQVNQLKLAQDSEATWYYNFTYPNFYPVSPGTLPAVLGQATAYSSALSCAEKFLVSDLISSQTTTDNYHIFFISDGTPDDGSDSSGRPLGCRAVSTADRDNCYLNNSLNITEYVRQAALAKGKNVKVYSVYYGKDARVPIVMDQVALSGGTAGGIKLNNFKDDQAAFCNMVSVQSSIDFQPENFFAIDLTLIRKNGKIQADSDMDGITDEEELELGSNAHNPRSKVPGVLDGICQNLGGWSSCLNRKNQINCNQNLFNKFNLTDCDIKILGLDKIGSPIDVGIDTDFDGVPDFIEIIKGSDPTVKDMNYDLDSDGIILRDELLKGMDPFTPDQELTLGGILNKFQVNHSKPDPNICPFGGWSMSLSRLQNTDILEVGNLPQEISNLQHLTNQHVVFMYYILSPMNDSNPVREIYGRLIQVNTELLNGKEKLNSSLSVLNKSDLVLIGKIR